MKVRVTMIIALTTIALALFLGLKLGKKKTDNKQMENLNNCNVLIEKTLGNSVFRFVKMQ